VWHMLMGCAGWLSVILGKHEAQNLGNTLLNATVGLHSTAEAI